MKIKTNAKYFCIVRSLEELKEAIGFAKKENVNFHFLGEGSNTVFASEYLNCLIIVNYINTFIEKNKYYDSECEACVENGEYEEMDVSVNENEKGEINVKVASGYNWDKFVNYMSERNIYGIEALAYIPGTVGGAVVQNIAAYGTELAEVLHEVEVLNTETMDVEIFKKEDCKFTYRNSFFKGNNKYLVLTATFTLSRINTKKLYKEVEVYLNTNGKTKTLAGEFFKIEGEGEIVEKEDLQKYLPIEITNAVTDIRKNKLADVNKFPNAGSFFKNPIIEKSKLQNILEKFPATIYHDVGEDKVKIGAGRMLEILGYKDYKFKDGEFGTYEKHALCIVHFGGGNFAKLANFINEIKENVKINFDIEIEEEPVFIK
jgi:UDP-N-acetylmuramate dehydrogenase